MKKIPQFIHSAFSLEYDRASDEEIGKAIMSGANVKGTNLFILMLAIFIASIGLNMNSTAVIIGAMLISPLMGGIMAIGYGMATNDITLVKKAFLGLLFQVVICIATSTFYFSITPFSAARSELLARTTPTIWDVLIALFGGLAGIIGVTRKEKTNVIPGVAIATALMPPLCTAGYGFAMGSLKFIVGATYLFFINSFFICISTVIIIRMMHIPKKSFINPKAEKKVKFYIYLIGIITILPSIYLGYQIVKDSVEDSNIARYISTELVFDNTQVVSSYINKDTGELKVALIGEPIDSNTINLLDNKLSQYSLPHLKLKVTQTKTSESLKYEDIESLINKELTETTNQIALGDRDEEIELLKTELIKYKTELIAYQSTDYDIASLTKELRAIYPQVNQLSLGRHKIFNTTTSEISYKVVATIYTRTDLSKEDRTRIINWLEVKTDTKDIALYVDVTAPTTTP